MYLIKVEDKPTNKNRAVPRDTRRVMWFGNHNRFLGSTRPTTAVSWENGIVRTYDAKKAVERIQGRLRPVSDLWERTVTMEELA